MQKITWPTKEREDALESARQVSLELANEMDDVLEQCERIANLLFELADKMEKLNI